MLLLTGVMHADTVFSENFDSTFGQFSLTTAGQFSTINGTNVDVVGTNGDANAMSFAFLCRTPASGNCVDMSGTSGNSAGNLELTTSLNLAPGTYLLSFDLLGSDRGSDTSTQVLFGSYNTTFDLASDDITSGVVTNALVTVTGGPTQLQFIDLGANDNVGAVLDNITIASTPEPGSLLLLATGLLGTAGMLRRKFIA
ncbi:MAG TPA: PEP-CTERM sorting domain-containing protein [Acidobacteriaceae bacterium]